MYELMISGICSFWEMHDDLLDAAYLQNASHGYLLPPNLCSVSLGWKLLNVYELSDCMESTKVIGTSSENQRKHIGRSKERIVNIVAILGKILNNRTHSKIGLIALHIFLLQIGAIEYCSHHVHDQNFEIL